MVLQWENSYPSSVCPRNTYNTKDLFKLLEDTSNKYPDSPALIFFKTRLTYTELYKKVVSLSNGLSGLGIRKGTKIGIMLPNCPQNIISFYALMRLGAVVVMINPMYVEKEIERQLNDAGAEFIIILDMFYKKVLAVKDRTNIKKIIITKLQEDMSGLIKLGYQFKLLISRKHTSIKPEKDCCLLKDLYKDDGRGIVMPKIDFESDLALLQYTGGTTGFSKGVMLTHKNLSINAQQATLWFSKAGFGKERFLAILPFFHSFGLTICMNTAINLGSAIIILPKFDIVMLLKTISRERPTIFPGVPSMFIAINNYNKVHRYDLSSIKFCISGAAPLPLEVINRFEFITNSRLVEGYGLTEASPVTHCNPVYGKRKSGSIGLPFPDTICKIVDLNEGRKEMGINETGELIIKGPQVMSGYWKRDDETNAVLRGGWLYTGDIAKMDEDGYFYIVDRKKDMIISGGYNIYPREVEEVLYSHPKVKEAVAVGIEDDYLGEIVKAYIVLKDGEVASRDTEADIKRFCEMELAKYKVPKKIEFRPSLPKNIIGKVLRRILREEEKEKTL